MLVGITKTLPYRPILHRVEVVEDSEPVTTTSVPCGLEKFDWVAGRVLEQDLLAAPAAYDLVAKVCPRLAHALDLPGEILDFELAAVPTSRLGLASVGHGLPCSPRSRRVQQEPQVVPREHRETGGGVKRDTETGMPGVEGNRFLDSLDSVTYADCGHRWSSFHRAWLYRVPLS